MDVRSEWLIHIARECQLLAGTCLPDHEVRIDSPLEQFLARLQEPRSPIERAILRGVLFETCVRFGEAVHVAYHATQADVLEDCGFEPGAFATRAAVVTEPRQMVMGWLDSYRRAFIQGHPGYLVGEARRALDDGFAAKEPLDALAKRYGTSVRRLKSVFAAAFGISAHEYVARKRVAVAIAMLRTTDDKVETITRAVGWTSRKDLNRALLSIAGVTPTDVRRGRAGST